VSPSTSTPQAAFRRPNPGTYTCRICQPNVKERGGWDAYYAHYNREHASTPTPQRRAS
jgi:hypothetical protein